MRRRGEGNWEGLLGDDETVLKEGTCTCIDTCTCT